ncbi:NAD(P)H dehydrogenase [quinone] 1-like [Mytilus galloprovincialis]|uniref:NAD(P)H dehydrogenase (Quinone) n=1 Tax=Mytilus galloprovincialis TaxID=29158 RepID=A0A8B6CNG0_MYTGA|nr:NAD(P)H dehydrogenase (quinone) [Mytilus galloprovincialis]
MYKKFLETQKTALIVYAHPEPKSFNAALRDTAVKTLKAQGYNVLVSDLYAQHFQPVISKTDIIGELGDPKHFNYPNEVGAAYEKDSLSLDIKQEIEKLKMADLVIFQFPMQWASVPAILKGWFERVLIKDFAFNFLNMFDEGLLKGKKCVLSMTTGSPGGMFTPNGLLGDLDIILWPIQYCTLRGCGFDVLKPHCIFSPAYADDKQREEMLNAWGNRLKNILTEEPLIFPSISNFDANKGFVMSDNYVEEQKNKENGPSVGHHLGKKMPL